MTEDRKETNPYCRCLFYAANALARNITRVCEEAFAPTGLAPSLGFALMTVNRQPGVQPSEVASIMMLSPSTVTRLVEKLEGKGLLRRESQGKAILLQTTEKGLQLQKPLLTAWQRTYEAYTGRIGEDASKALTEQVFDAALRLE
jgi:DNA-binding MarR family transcriptional regulator